jgi:hypothetical protein
VLLSWKSSRISFRSMWMAIGCGLWDKFLALWSSRNKFMLRRSSWSSGASIQTQFISQVEFCIFAMWTLPLFPSSSYWRVLPFKEDSLLDLVFDTFKKIGWFSRCRFEFGCFKFLDPFTSVWTQFFHVRGLMGLVWKSI